ncbi:uracil-DNA glycosylase [Virgisporangium aurantiacum]|uniref:Uracil-DNA glycosylase n=1 Tax=Virgisporangium aurantiacum TaxID=175570 RepID=A0A8J3ZHZ0_9ACTN|nr:uracil-DNA glycosylase [Virgisporangium aurantiacum]GIJ62235.1 uracil-DNA glycosylase [Virgisporangium aurantiacum]
MTVEPLTRDLDPGWAAALAPVLPDIDAMDDFLRSEAAAGRPYLPERTSVLRAFREPFHDVRVVIVGQDPYPTRGHANGLSFAAPRSVTPSSCLVNILREYSVDLGLPMPSTGDLTPWAERGVLLLNTVLTVREGMPASHQGRGWEAVTGHALRALAGRDRPLVAVLWGHRARAHGRLLAGVAQIASAHPSTMSAASGFCGSRPFTRVNELLRRCGAEPVDWRLS